MNMESKNEAGLHEIRFHGRGGQGAVSAAALLALAAFEDGSESQAFPKFGSERRGAPVEAYVRISDTVIRVHNQVYKPDAIVIQDATLLHSQAVLQGLKNDGLIVLNSEKQANDFEQRSIDNFRWVCIPASRIGQELLGRPLPNTVLLGVLSACSGWVSCMALELAVANHLVSKGEAIVKANIDAIREGYRLGTMVNDSEKDKVVS